MLGYEPEGFLVDGCGYLPDFYLPDLDCYFEVKGYDEYDLGRLERFAQLIGKPLIVAEGVIPDPEEMICEKQIGLQFLRPSQPDDQPENFLDEVAYGYKDMFLRCQGCGRIRVMNENYSTMKGSCGCGDESARLMPLSDALGAARSARFEHGSDPTPTKLIDKR